MNQNDTNRQEWLDGLRLRSVEARERNAAANERIATALEELVHHLYENHKATVEYIGTAADDFEELEERTIPPYRQKKHERGPSSYGLSSVSDLAKHFKMSVPELKDYLRKHGIEYDTYLKDLDPSANSNYVKAEGVEKLNGLLSTNINP